MNLVGCLRKLEFPSHGDRHTVIMNAELNRNYRGDIWHLDSYRMKLTVTSRLRKLARSELAMGQSLLNLFPCPVRHLHLWRGSARFPKAFKSWTSPLLVSPMCYST